MKKKQSKKISELKYIVYHEKCGIKFGTQFPRKHTCKHLPSNTKFHV